LFALLLKNEGASGDLAGDGTGYSVSVENHYRTNPNKFGKKFVHFFSLIDLALGCMLDAGYHGCLSGTLSLKQSLC
jgi:transposase